MGKIIKIIVAVLGLVALFFAYTIFFGSSSTSSSLLTSKAAANTPGSDLINQLLQLKSLQLDDSLFANPQFTSLKDFDVVIQPFPQGRVNPFAPIGFEGDAAVTSQPSPAPTAFVTSTPAPSPTPSATARPLSSTSPRPSPSNSPHP